MTDPRFFRRYLEILDEQQPTMAAVDVDDNTKVSVDLPAKQIGVSTKVGDTDLKATQDFSTAKTGAGQVSVDTPVAPGTTAGATYTQAGYKGQMTPTNQIRMSYKDTAGALGKPGQTHNVAYTQGAMLGGASGANVGKNVATTYTKS
jgi:hypothetical protein